MHNLSYAERLKSLGIYSLQRRRDRYMAIYMWKILERKVPNFSPPIQCHISDRRGRLCSSGVVPTDHLGTLCHNSIRNRAATLFNCLPKHIRNIVNCANPIMFKRALHGQSSVFNRRLSYGAKRVQQSQLKIQGKDIFT